MEVCCSMKHVSRRTFVKVAGVATVGMGVINPLMNACGPGPQGNEGNNAETATEAAAESVGDASKESPGAEAGQEPNGPEAGPEAGQEPSGPEAGPEAGQEPSGPEAGPEAGQEPSGPEAGPEAGPEPSGPEAGPEAGPEPSGPEDTRKKIVVKLTDAPAIGSSKKLNHQGDTIILIRKAQKDFTAVSDICTHNGCSVAWSGSSLDCPCHGSSYAADGSVINGPAQNSLTSFTVEYKDTLQEVWIIIP
jgi:Rieske Fe-S protein